MKKKTSLNIYSIDKACFCNYFCRIYIVCYRKRQENTKFIFSFPGKTKLKLKNIPKSARFSNFGVHPLPMHGWYICCFGFNGSLIIPSNVKPSPRKKENEKKKIGINRSKIENTHTHTHTHTQKNNNKNIKKNMLQAQLAFALLFIPPVLP